MAELVPRLSFVPIGVVSELLERVIGMKGKKGSELSIDTRHSLITAVVKPI